MTCNVALRLLAIAVLIIVALIVAPPAGAKPAPGYTPICTEVTAVTLILDGRYAAVTCPQGRLSVSVLAGQPAPALGPARVAPSAAAAGIYDLVDTTGNRYRISH